MVLSYRLDETLVAKRICFIGAMDTVPSAVRLLQCTIFFMLLPPLFLVIWFWGCLLRAEFSLRFFVWPLFPQFPKYCFFIMQFIAG